MTANEVPRKNHPLSSLRPKFVEKEHGGYVDYLRAALDDETPTAPRNIALTGSYGSGKSSILSEVQRTYGESKVVGVSLSTVAVLADSADGDKNGAISNSIQKEIVKQLLYREIPAKLASSRFRRIEPFSKWRAWLVGFALATAAVSIGFLTNSAERLETAIGPSRELRGIVWAAAFAIIAVAVVLIQRAFHNRLRISGFTAGPATVVAGEKDEGKETYFDKYLDEIVYFFGATSCSVVIFEDLDRFNEIEIYEELRELNTILNNSKQVGRPIRFVYAMRDSLFEEIGSAEADSDDATGPLRVASARAKFFDLVVPVVPFATGRTSLDLWYREMNLARAEISMGALSIAAKHVHDMRMIKNVRNEFDVFLGQILRNELTGLRLRPDSLFALMVYKAVHLEDFESIRFGRSHLDGVESLRRRVIADTVRDLEQKARAIETGSRRRAELEALSLTLGTRLQEGVERSFRLARRAMATYEYHVDGTVFPSTATRTVEFWKAVTRNGAELELVGATSTSLSAEDVNGLVDASVEELDWDSSVDPALALEVQRAEQDRDSLLHAEVSSLLTTPNLDIGDHKSVRTAFRDEAMSSLAYDFLEAGYIDRNFSLYVSRFYGEVVSANAMNFVIHVIQPGVMDVNAQLENIRDVNGIIAESGLGWMSTRSALNTNLVDLLINDERLDVVIERLSQADADALTFLDSYATRGLEPAKLLERLAPSWSGVVGFALRAAEADPTRAAELLDGALHGATLESSYEPILGLGTFVRKNAESLTALTGEQAVDSADALLDLLSRDNARLVSLKIVAEPLRSKLASHGLFELSQDNLQTALGAAENWTIDQIRAVGNPLFSRVLSEPDEYLGLLPEGASTISATASLEAVVRAIDGVAEPRVTAEIVDRADPALRIEELANIPVRTWPHLLESDRVEGTARNWYDYQLEIGLDGKLTKLLSMNPQLSGVEDLTDEERRQFAASVIEHEDIAPMKRARVAASLEIDGFIDVTTLPKLEGPTFGYLLSKGVIEDSVVSFDHLSGVSWETRSTYIRYSKKFTEYAGSAKFSAPELVKVFYDAKVSDAVKTAIFNSYATLSAAFVPAVASVAAAWAAKKRPRISVATIHAMAAANADGPSMVSLLMAYRMSDADVAAGLASMKGPYKNLAQRGYSRPVVPNTPEMLELLMRLKKMGTVSSWNDYKGNSLRVNLHH